MRIAYIIPSKVKFGPNLVVLDLVKLMMEKNHQVKVFYFDEVTNDALIDFPCKIERIKFTNKINFEEWDVIHSHCLRPDAYVFVHKPRKCNTRFVTTIHNFVREDLKATYNPFISKIISPIWMMLLKRHDMRVALSRTAMEYYYEWFKKDEITYVYNTRKLDAKGDLTEEQKKEILDFKGDSYLLGVNAGETSRKGADQIIRALPYLPDVKLFMVWRAPDRPDLRQLAKELNVEKQILFAGFREDAYRYQKYYDAFVIPSRSEGFPLAMLEAVALKCNMISSDIPIFKEFFEDDEISFFHLEDTESMVNAIRESQKNNKSEKAYRKYLKSFSPDVIANRYLEVYSAK